MPLSSAAPRFIPSGIVFSLSTPIDASEYLAEQQFAPTTTMEADSLAQAKYSALLWNSPLSIAHANTLLDKLDLYMGMSIVDIGCGWGEFLLLATGRIGPEVHATGIDTNQLLLDRGKRNAAKRNNLSVKFIQRPAEKFREKQDRAICIGASHAFGGTRGMLLRLAEIVPKGRILVGDMCWERTPTDESRAIFGDEVLSLADLVTLCRETGWEMLSLSTADQREWDEFESGIRAGPREWLLANPEDPRAAGVREEQSRREHEYLTKYRGVLGMAYLVLGR